MLLCFMLFQTATQSHPEIPWDVEKISFIGASLMLNWLQWKSGAKKDELNQRLLEQHGATAVLLTQIPALLDKLESRIMERMEQVSGHLPPRSGNG